MIDTHNDTPPKISIGLPIFNGERYLESTLDSLLNQTYHDFELIISDNASTDRSAEICREYAAKDPRIVYHRYEENRGAAWNFNNTVELSQGQYFKWAAHDDLHHPDFLSRCIEVLEQNPGTVLCFSKTTFIDENGKKLRDKSYPIDLSKTPRRQRFLHFAASGDIITEIFGLIRADVLKTTPLIRGFVGSDIVLLGELALNGTFYEIPEYLFLHREHPDRSAIATKNASGYTRWFDPSKSGTFVMPYWKRLAENARTVFRHPMSLKEKVGCWIDLCRAANWRRSVLLEEVRNAFRALVYRLRQHNE